MNNACLKLADHLGLAPALIKQCLELNRQGLAYREWHIPKPSGGTRLISHPKGEMLKLHYALYPFLHPYADPYYYGRNFPKIAYGCLPGPARAVRDCLEPHQKSTFLITLDIKDAYHSVKFCWLHKRLKEGLFWHHPTHLAALDALTELLVVRKSPLARSYLPQGSPASPTTFHLVMKNIDWLLYQWSQKQNLTITRYVDCYGISGLWLYGTKTPLEKMAADVAETILKLSDGYLKINPQKTTCQLPCNGSVAFRWLGAVIERDSFGQSHIRIDDEKLTEYCQFIDEAIAKHDFSEETQLTIRGIQAWASSLSRGKIPRPLAERLQEYKHQARSPDENIVFLHPDTYPYIDGQGVLFAPIYQGTT